ncbi:active breakpoint cluster region-related protein-like [Hydra vulgaris]|uniref:Active breakpoint cluster region-related protein-like n=1 Tax=Hydra vulgaris TaxID=6087 RepID=A0ABM4DHL6_HYDVU
MSMKFKLEKNHSRPKQYIIDLLVTQFDPKGFNKVRDSSSFPDINKDVRIYKSDKVDLVQRKYFTRSLNVSLYNITNCQDEGYFSCSIDIDGETKAKTSEKIMKKVLIIAESFEIEINEASSVELNLFLNDVKIDTGKIYLRKLLAYESKAQVLLITDEFGIKLNLSIEFIGIDSFLKRTPSKRFKGLFGFTIAQTLIDDGNTIPLIVRKCVYEIEMRGFSLEGIYRISGNAWKKTVLRAIFEEKNIENDSIDEFDCHVISGVLKDYLRELPEPLIPQNLFFKLYKMSLQGNRSSSYNTALFDIIKNVHYSNRATLIYIMEHLLRVSSRKDENKMNFKNIAVCFGPVMMCPPAETSEILDFKKQVDALEYLLEIWLFNQLLHNKS